MTDERVLFAGFGGQGIMSIGQLLAYAGMVENKNVTWIPSYGPEMRGGTAYCSVVVSDKEIGSPIVTTNASSAIIMNLPSLLKFKNSVEPGGLLLVNSSLIDRQVERSDLHVYYINADDYAAICGNKQAANIVMLGAYVTLAEPVNIYSVLQVLPKVFGDRPDQFWTLNSDALHLGAEVALGGGRRLEAA